MKRKNIIFLILITITLLLLTACTRSATRATGTTSANETQSPVSTQSQIMKDILSGTQTAMAVTPAAAEKATPKPTKTAAPASSAPTEAPTAVPAATEKPKDNTVDSYPTATPGIPATYTIQKDEFPFCIARRFNVSAGDLLSVNGLNLDSYVVPGFKLTIPQNSTFVGQRSLRSHPTDYTVQAGDSIGKIACLFGDVDPYNIFAVNGLEQGAALNAGQVLHIP